MRIPDERLSAVQIADLLQPYLRGTARPPPELLYVQLQSYLELLVRWNARTNLTALRDPQEIVRRHFGESLFAGTLLPTAVTTLLDLGSGAGFPGLPMQLLRPNLKVTLAESQVKKASFLREVVRTLGLPTAVHAERAETLVGRVTFDVVALRAVDAMASAVELAGRLTRGTRIVLTTRTGVEQLGVGGAEVVVIPDGATRLVALLR